MSQADSDSQERDFQDDVSTTSTEVSEISTDNFMWWAYEHELITAHEHKIAPDMILKIEQNLYVIVRI
jgi:hypothetical protein